MTHGPGYLYHQLPNIETHADLPAIIQDLHQYAVAPVSNRILKEISDKDRYMTRVVASTNSFEELRALHTLEPPIS